MGLQWKIDFNLSTRASRIISLMIFRVQTLVIPPYIFRFICIMDQNVSYFLLYTHILISQKINFVKEVRFSQKRSHMYFTILNWSFFSTCTLLQCIETSGVNAHHFSVLNLVEHRFRTSLNESSCVLAHHFTDLKVFDYIYYTSLYWTIWIHIPHFTILTHYWKNVLYFKNSNLLNYKYLTSLY